MKTLAITYLSGALLHYVFCKSQGIELTVHIGKNELFGWPNEEIFSSGWAADVYHSIFWYRSIYELLK